MTTRRNSPLTRKQAEAVLKADDRPAYADNASEHVRRVLAAASATGAPIEADREATALAAFRTRGAGVTASTRSRRAAAKTRFFTSRVIAVFVAGGVATGGVAYAASTGHLPGTSTHPGVSTSRPDAPASSNVHGRSPSGSSAAGSSGATTGGSVAASSIGSPTGPAGSGTASADPAFIGLCTAYESGVAASKGKALSNPAFSALINAAGGLPNVDAYCARLGVLGKSASATATASTGSTASASKSHGPPATPPGQTKSH